MTELASLYAKHLQSVVSRYDEIIQLEGLDGILLHSGQLKPLFFDDQHYPFKITPLFSQWLPEVNIENCWLIIEADKKPTLIYYQPEDYWHHVAPLPPSHLADFFYIHILLRPEQVANTLPKNLKAFAYIGPNPEVAQVLGINSQLHNPESVLNFLYFHRAWKTEYEIFCIKQANEIAVKGHVASRSAFFQGASELEIFLEYLAAIGQGENTLPYSAIVAMNEHSATLHYTNKCRRKRVSQDRRSFLIDSGAKFNGYGSDISRTYSYRKDYFSELIQKVDDLQLALIDDIKIGQRFTELQELAHQRIAQLLVDEQFVFCSVEQVLEKGLVSYFFPHGIGHHIGLQTHDVAGFMQNERGALLSPPEQHVFLRCTRLIEPDQVITIEPGIYFIPLLLKKLADSSQSSVINWELIEIMKPFGGIRVEDNILISRSANVNLTRSQNWQ